MSVPFYFNPTAFYPGQEVMYGEFKARIRRHYYEGMWEICLPGGVACVSGANLKVM